MTNEYIYQNTFIDPNDLSTSYTENNNIFLYERIIDKINEIIDELEELKKLIKSF